MGVYLGYVFRQFFKFPKPIVFRKLSLYLLFIISLILTGCAVGPNTQRIAEFGEAAQKANEVLITPFNLSRSLGVEITRYNNACLYLASPNGVGGELAASNDIKVQTIVSELRLVHLALGRYTSALASVTDPASLDALRTAGAAFASETTNALGVATPAPIDSAIAPAVNLSVNLFITLSEVERVRQIKEIMLRVNPSIELLGLKLETDTSIIVSEMDRILSQWDEQARCILVASSRENKDTSSLFSQLDERKRFLLSQRQSVSKLAKLFKAVAEIHSAAADQPASIDQKLDSLNLLLADIEALASVL